MGYVVTIDGPAASGKSSVSRELAKRMGWKWISTGAFYRGLAYVAQQEGLSLTDEKALVALTESAIWSIQMNEDQTDVYYRNRIVTDEISKDQVGQWASLVSRLPGVRASLLKNQRDCETQTQGLVAEGRDCGSVVFPEAPIKVYLTADQVQRATRRAQDLGMTVEETVQSQETRDRQDSSRKVAPLQIPKDAWVLDTTHLSLLEAVGLIEERIKSSLGDEGETEESTSP